MTRAGVSRDAWNRGGEGWEERRMVASSLERPVRVEVITHVLTDYQH